MIQLNKMEFGHLCNLCAVKRVRRALYPGNCLECRLVRGEDRVTESICSVCCAGWAENRRRGRRGGGQARRSSEAGRADHQDGGAGPPKRERCEAGLDRGEVGTGRRHQLYLCPRPVNDQVHPQARARSSGGWPSGPW